MAVNKAALKAAIKAAWDNHVPIPLFLALVGRESTWNPNALSKAGAIGYTQLMPGTAAALGVDPYNPAQNLKGGAKYLREQYDAFGSWTLALAAYNAGPNAVRKYGGVPPFAETQSYVKNVLADAKTKYKVSSDKLGGLGPIINAITSSPPGKAVKDIGSAAGDAASGNFTGAAGDVVKAGIALSPVGLTSGALTKAADLLGVGAIAGDVLKVALVIVVVLVVLALSGGLFYSGVRRLSGDRLPTATDFAAARVGAKA